MELIRDCLDKQVVDPRGRPMGRVDGIVLDVPGSEQPQLTFIELGAITRLNRVHPRLAKLYEVLATRLAVRDLRPYRISWTKAVSTATEIVVDEQAEKSRALAFERWLRRKVVQRIPGS